MTSIAFMTANYVARELGYHMTEGWMQGDGATQSFFRPIETFGERFDALLAEIRALGFTEMDIWLAHLHPDWATEEHVRLAREKLAAHGLRVISLAGWFGGTAEEFERACKLAVGLGAGILGGNTGLLESDRPTLERLLAQYGLRFGLENHPEKTPAEVLAKIVGTDPARVGVTVDTGWFGTQGYDAAQALHELAGRLVYVHLKDVEAAGGHVTCGFGEGVVPIERCVRMLQLSGYEGGLSIEHEPEHEDPRPAVAASLALLRGWLAG